MRKIIVLLLIIGAFAYVYTCRAYWFLRPVTKPLDIERIQYKEPPAQLLTEGIELLRLRKDNAAWINFSMILTGDPNNNDALWGKAEILRRKRNYKDAEEILNRIIAQEPKHTPSLLTLAYIRYKEDRLDEAQTLIAQVMQCYPDKESEALAYMLLGALNSRRATKGGVLAKISNGTQIKCYLLKAKELAPDLPEVRLALGTFYLEAPLIIGGNLNRAFEELVATVNLAPDFATANARLAQYYRKKSDYMNYNAYRQKAEELDPENEVLQEMK